MSNQQSLRKQAQVPKVVLNGEECEVLIPLLAEGTCKIKNIQIVYDLIYKLQECINATEQYNKKQ
jgi:hypothetical protein